MSAYYIQNAHVLLESGFRDDVIIKVDRGEVKGVQVGQKSLAASETVVDLDGDFLIPGLFDIQVNGGGGVLFNDDPTVGGIKTIAEAHRDLGTTSLLPTLISDRTEVIESGIRTVQQAIEDGVPGVLGIHIEGPCLSTEKGGIHKPEYFRQMDDALIDLCSSLKNGKTLLTVAPEAITPAQIRELVANGVTVSLGHSNASSEQTHIASEAGASCFTHLFNAMSSMMNRAPGMTGAALLLDDMWSSIIVDGHHVHQEMLEIAVRCRDLRKMVLISDAMALTGSDETHFFLQGQYIEKINGTYCDEWGTLAGAALTLFESVRNAIRIKGVHFPDAVYMASRNPAELLGLDGKVGSIQAGAKADFLRLSRDYQLKAVCTAGNWP